jgi:hypothetical protein
LNIIRASSRNNFPSAVSKAPCEARLEQVYAQFILQIRDLTAQGRLRHAQARRCLGEI